MRDVFFLEARRAVVFLAAAFFRLAAFFTVRFFAEALATFFFATFFFATFFFATFFFAAFFLALANAFFAISFSCALSALLMPSALRAYSRASESCARSGLRFARCSCSSAFASSTSCSNFFIWARILRFAAAVFALVRRSASRASRLRLL
ncbi:MAG: hypothetical protein C0629_16970 [Chromatiales bacterium]|nr:MAG: hypothetical protein C0629_16970 [Chromatiales bacterium]